MAFNDINDELDAFQAKIGVACAGWLERRAGHEQDRAEVEELLHRIGAETAVVQRAVQETLRQRWEEVAALRGALHDEHWHYRNLFDSAPTPFLVTDTSGIIDEANQAAALMLNVQQEKLQGRALADFVVAEDRYLFDEWLADMSVIQQMQALEIRLQPVSQVSTVVTIIHVALVHLGKAEHELQWSIHDITERKQAELKLKRAVDELATANRYLASSNKDLESFAYVASHDLQEPLRTIRSYMQLIEKRYGERFDSDIREYFGFAAEGAGRLLEMTQDLLTYSRVNMQTKPLAPTDSSMALELALKSLGEAIREANATVREDGLPRILADCGQLTQLFQNLIANAIKFRRRDVPPVVRVSAYQNCSTWVFSVADNGIGIDSKYHDQIFGVFKRLHCSSEYKGSGIGLAVCKRIVERHGGEMCLDSKLGQGSTFYFTMPKA